MLLFPDKSSCVNVCVDISLYYVCPISIWNHMIYVLCTHMCVCMYVGIYVYMYVSSVCETLCESLKGEYVGGEDYTMCIYFFVLI